MKNGYQELTEVHTSEQIEVVRSVSVFHASKCSHDCSQLEDKTPEAPNESSSPFDKCDKETQVVHSGLVEVVIEKKSDLSQRMQHWRAVAAATVVVVVVV